MPTEQIQPDAPLYLATLIVLAILGASMVLWIRFIQKPKNVVSINAGAPAWQIGWLNFGIFACAIILIVVTVQIIGGELLFDPPLDPEAEFEITPKVAVAAVLLLQLPMLAVFYLARRFFPNMYAGRISSIEFSPGQALAKAVPLFLMFLPVIWISMLLWTQLLDLLQATGLIENFEQQELVTLFQNGGDPIYIGLLVCFAVILAPIVEEIIFRGCVYRFLKSQMTIIPAQIISGLIFSMMHANLMSFLPLVLVGMLLAHVYEKTGSLLVAIWFHAFFNGFSLLMLFITGLSQAIPQ